LGFPNTFFKLLQLLLDMAARLPVGQSAGDYRGGGSDQRLCDLALNSSFALMVKGT